MFIGRLVTAGIFDIVCLVLHARTQLRNETNWSLTLRPQIQCVVEELEKCNACDVVDCCTSSVAGTRCLKVSYSCWTLYVQQWSIGSLVYIKAIDGTNALVDDAGKL